MKKFYQTVSVVAADTPDHFKIFLDGKPVQTPSRQVFVVAGLHLANAIADEWRNQKDRVVIDSMPLSQLSMTLTDRVIPNRAILTEEALGYLDTDLVCYRTDDPPITRDAQQSQWNPVIEWFVRKFGTPLQTTTELAPLQQSPDAHQQVLTFVKGLSDAEFMALYLATLGTGSLILALGFVSGEFSVPRMMDAAFVEEQIKDKIYLAEIYGSAPDQEKKRKTVEAELQALKSFLQLLSTS